MQPAAPCERAQRPFLALGSASRDICNWGGTALDLAIAVLESKSMRANYPLGDVYPNGQRKCGDAANFGIFKQNWLMIRSSWPAFADLSSGCYLKGAILNSNLRLDIDMLHGCQNRYGLDRV